MTRCPPPPTPQFLALHQYIARCQHQRRGCWRHGHRSRLSHVASPAICPLGTLRRRVLFHLSSDLISVHFFFFFSFCPPSSSIFLSLHPFFFSYCRRSAHWMGGRDKVRGGNRKMCQIGKTAKPLETRTCMPPQCLMGFNFFFSTICIGKKHSRLVKKNMYMYKNIYKYKFFWAVFSLKT